MCIYIYICACRSFDYGTKWYCTTSYNGTWDLITHVNQNMFINFIHTIYIQYVSLGSLLYSEHLYLFVIWCHMYLSIYIYIYTWIFQVFLRPASNHRGKTYHIISDFRKRIWFQKKHLSLLGLHLKWKGYYTSGLGSKPEVVLNVSRIGESPKLCLQNSAKRQPHPIRSNKYHHIYVYIYIYIYVDIYIYIYIYVYILYQRRESWLHENLDFHCGRAETGHTLRHHRPWLHPIPSPWKPVMVEVMLPLKSRAFPANHLRLKGIDYINLYNI